MTQERKIMSKADELLKGFVEYIDQPRASDKVDIVKLLKETLSYLKRKNELVVGSQWVCDVECVGGFNPHYKDEVCNVTKLFDDEVYIKLSINYEEDEIPFYDEDEIPLGQFLACFIPKNEL